MNINYAMADSFLGPIIAGFTEKGICSIEFGEDYNALVAALTTRFPNAEIDKGGPTLAVRLTEIVDFIQHPEKGLSLPLDIQGTAFQQRVWKALLEIPVGETRTYSDIAEAIGNPSSVRAVATAIASNPLAVVIPCHRVLRKDGTPSGYRWGLGKKESLLDNEGATRK